jgi:transcriptional regulator with XRE-family HTH domain
LDSDDYLVKPWNQSSIARLLETTPTTVNRWLRSKRYPSIQLMRRIERRLKWSLLDQLNYIPDSGYDPRYAARFEEILDARFGDGNGKGSGV